MDAKDNLFFNIVSAFKNSEINQSFTTEDIVKRTGQHRNLVSHYLNRLVEDKKLKKSTTRPVYYSLPDQMINRKIFSSDQDVFSTFIGSKGSLSRQVELCKAAVTYPPDGLPVLICGPSGTGKSYLATYIHKFACHQNVIKNNSALISLNCADYANNPELLSDTLFGHIKGAYTGADTDKTGLLDQADGGFLFLDEVHRLSPENQEKLFLFLDQGKFRRLGENDLDHHAHVRFIFATSENKENVLLETFQRRIPVKIILPTFLSRPISERSALINQFFFKEACHLNKEVWIPAPVYHSLIFYNSKGNIGGIKNLIKVRCAEAYSKQSKLPYIKITNNMAAIRLNNAKKKANHGKIYKINFQYNHQHLFTNSSLTDIHHILESFYKNSNIYLFIKSMDEYFQINMGNSSLSSPPFTFISDIVRDCIKKLAHLTGITLKKEIVNAIVLVSFYFMNASNSPNSEIKVNSKYHHLSEKKSKSELIALKLITLLDNRLFRGNLESNNYKMILYFISVLFRQVIQSNNQIQGIIVAHGEAIASSITSVANRICGGYFFEAFDMPLASDSNTIITEVSHYLEDIDTKEGVILLVDMGSLTQLYEPIKGQLQGDLLMINNITTSMAIDIGIKIKRHLPLHKIINEAKKSYKIKMKYYEGIAMNDNIVISCISGIGIAKKIKNIIQSFMQNHHVEIITLDYFKLKSLLKQKQSSTFGKTKLIISTTPLDSGNVPFINIHELISQKSHIALKEIFSEFMDDAHFHSMIDEIIKLFTINGAASRLQFLNPTIIVDEISDIIQQFEKYYHIHFQSYVKINLFLHISVMIERLMVNKETSNQPHVPLTDEQKQFCRISDGFFKKITKKYHVQIPNSEKLMILEIIKMSFPGAAYEHK